MKGKRAEQQIAEALKQRRPLREDIEAAADRAEAGPLPVDGLAGEGERAPIATEAEWIASDPALVAKAIGEGLAPAARPSDGYVTALEKAEEYLAETQLKNPATLAGDMRDRILNQIVRQEKTWQKMLNYEQAVLADQIYKICKDCVAGAVKIILDVPFAHVDVAIDKLNIDKDIKLSLSTPLTGGALAKLGEALHKPACLILASAADFQGQQRAAQTDPDQPSLKLDIVEAPAPAAEPAAEADDEPDGDAETDEAA